MLLAHGPVVSDRSLRDAAHPVEELEEAAKLFLLPHGTGRGRCRRGKRRSCWRNRTGTSSRSPRHNIRNTGPSGRNGNPIPAGTR